MPDGSNRRWGDDQESPVLGLSQRLPPSNIQAEQALLGALLANNKAYERVSEFLAPDHFADPIHGRIYQAIARRAEAGQLADAVMLKEEFEHSGALQDVGGTAYLAQLLTAMVGIINAGEYGRAIYDAWGRRQLIEFGENVVNAAFGDDPTKTTPEILAEADKNLGGLTDAYHRDGRGSVISAIDAVDLALTEGEMAAKGKGPSSVSTGIAGLDQLILRLRAGNLYVVGGRPGMGKTALARSIAVNVSREKVTQDGELLAGDPVAYFSMEEGHAEFGAAIIAQLAGVPIAATLNGEWTDAQFQKLDKARQQARGLQLDVVRRKVSVTDIGRECRQISRKRKRKLSLVVVDYLQLMPDPPNRKDKRLAVGENAYGLKHLAEDLGCAVIALSQLSRAVEDRSDKRPTMRDLRESGEIEDAADVILFPFRQEYYLKQDRPVRNHSDGESNAAYQHRLAEWQSKIDSACGQAELPIPKVRRGNAPVHLDLFFDAERTRFCEASI